MGRPRKKSLQFSTEDRNELQRIASSRTEPAARVSRARALLAYEDGDGTNAEIASEAGMSTVALANLVNKCITFGPMVALNDLPRSGRKSVITDEDKAYVKHIACYKPKDFGYPEELWSDRVGTDGLSHRTLLDLGIPRFFRTTCPPRPSRASVNPSKVSFLISMNRHIIIMSTAENFSSPYGRAR